MRIRELGSRPASAALQEWAARLVPRREPAVPVARREIPYWQEQGWRRQGHDEFVGSYQTPYGTFSGWIRVRGNRQFEFLIYDPPEAIKRDSHWACFQPRGGGWYAVHMGRRPKDLSSGVITIERLLTKALGRR